jgi:hypothetical protein
MKEYDKKTLHPILDKSYIHLHLVEDVASSCVKQNVDHDYGLHVFQMTNNNAKITNEIVIKELLDFRKFHVDVKI